MTDTTNRPFDSSDPKQLVQFRKAAAGIIRDILSAVNQTHQKVLTNTTRQHWWTNKKQPSTRAPKKLLENAAQNLRRFERDFVGYGDSLPSPNNENGLSPDEQLEQLRDLVLRFADPIELDQAACAFNDRKVAWDKLCSWESLPEIRRLLDALPDAEDHGYAQTEMSITELVAEPPNVIKYLGRPIRGVTPGIWKLINYLLSCMNCATTVQSLMESVWDHDDVTSNENEWIRIDSLLGDTRKCFKTNAIPFSVSRKVRLGQVFLKKLEQLPDAADSPPKRQRKKSPQTGKSSNRPVKKSTPKKKTNRHQ